MRQEHSRDPSRDLEQPLSPEETAARETQLPREEADVELEEMANRLKYKLRARVESGLAPHHSDRKGNDASAGQWASRLQVLTGERYGTADERERMASALRSRVKESLDDPIEWFGGPLSQLSASSLRILTGESYGTTEERDRIVTSLKARIRHDLDERHPLTDNLSAESSAMLRVLTGESYGTMEERERMMSALKSLIHGASTRKPDIRTAETLFALKLLRASELRFTPGEGIEIIDQPSKAEEGS